MKNKYVMPELAVVEIKYATSLMSGSPQLTGTYQSGGKVLGREFSFDEDNAE